MAMTFKGMTKAFLFLLPLHVSQVNASEIVISGADVQWGVSLEVSEQLITFGCEVKPRIIAQYSNTIYVSGLTGVPETFNDLASTLAPSRRLIINQAGSFYRAVLTIPDGTSGEVFVEEKTDKPEIFALFQNYPNPFNPQTEISFHLPESSYITLEIFNTLGQKVVTLVDGKGEAGRYRITWDGTGFTSGVYFYRLATGNFVETRKMLMIR